MLDIVYLAAIIAVFVVVGLIGRGVERLGPPAVGADRRPATGGEERP